MLRDAPDFCVERLAAGRLLAVRDAAGWTVTCCVGTVWITQESDERDIYLKSGESFTFDRPGVALICAVDGMKGGPAGDAGTAIRLPARLVRARTRR